jgi:thiamine biosynthesis protein ThiS
MTLTVNGEARELPEGTSVRDLLAALGVRLDAVAVERNGTLVRRRDFDALRLADGDRVEIVTFVGGG